MKAIRLPDELVDWLRAEAEARILGPGKLAEILLEDGLANLPPLPSDGSRPRRARG